MNFQLGGLTHFFPMPALPTPARQFNIVTKDMGSLGYTEEASSGRSTIDEEGYSVLN